MKVILQHLVNNNSYFGWKASLHNQLGMIIVAIANNNNKPIQCELNKPCIEDYGTLAPEMEID